MPVLLQVPCCVCPCCVFPKAFPGRMLMPEGRVVRTYHDFVTYLQRKHPRVRTAQLQFNPTGDEQKSRSTILFMRAEDFAEKSKEDEQRPGAGRG